MNPIEQEKIRDRLNQRTGSLLCTRNQTLFIISKSMKTRCNSIIIYYTAGLPRRDGICNEAPRKPRIYEYQALFDNSINNV